MANENPFGKGIITRKAAPKIDNPFGRGIARPVRKEPVSQEEREPHEVTREERVMKEFNKAPMSVQALQAADDMTRLFSTGASYGSLDTFGNAESRFQTDDARARAGIPGTAMEIGGMVASPVTRLVGAGARALPGTGLLPRVAKATGEGATLGGIGALLSDNPENLVQDMAMGGALPPAIMAAGKLGTSFTKYFSAMLSGKEPKFYNEAFKAGREGGPVGQAFTEGQKRGVDSVMSNDLLEKLSPSKADWDDSADFGPIGNKLIDFISSKRTADGVFDLNAKELKDLNKINNEVLKAGKRPPTIENLHALKTKLGGFNAGKKQQDSTIGRFATQLQRTIDEQITKQNKTYGKDLATYSKGKAAFEAGQKLSRTIPSLQGALGVGTSIAGPVAATIGGWAFNPALWGAIPAAMAMSSPKLAGKIAKKTGEIRGIGDLLAGGQSDTAVPMAVYNSLSEKDKKKLRNQVPGIR